MHLHRPLAECCGACSLGGQQEEVDANERMLSVQFSWNGQLKDVSSMFIGTSPEFELALYTLCFLTGQEDNIVAVGDYEVKIKVYRIKSKYGDKVGSAYPEVNHLLQTYMTADALCRALYWCVIQLKGASYLALPKIPTKLLKQSIWQLNTGKAGLIYSCVLHAADSEAVRTAWRPCACASTVATTGPKAHPGSAIECAVSTICCWL